MVVTLGTGIGAGFVSAAHSSGVPRVRGRSRPHGRGSFRAAVLVRPARMLGALCIGQRSGPSGPRGGASAGRLGGVMALVEGDAESVRGEHVTRLRRPATRVR